MGSSYYTTKAKTNFDCSYSFTQRIRYYILIFAIKYINKLIKKNKIHKILLHLFKKSIKSIKKHSYDTNNGLFFNYLILVEGLKNNKEIKKSEFGGIFDFIIHSDCGGTYNKTKSERIKDILNLIISPKILTKIKKSINKKKSLLIKINNNKKIEIYMPEKFLEFYNFIMSLKKNDTIKIG